MAQGINKILDEAALYLQMDFGLSRPRAEFNSCSDSEWKKFRVKSQAFYHPREGKVFLGPDASLAEIVHEYFGHALYAEQTSLGQKLNVSAKRISDLEKKKGIPIDSKLTIKPSNKFKIQKTDNGYYLYCDVKDPEMQNYLKLKKEYLEFFNKVKPLHEGFSIWIENKILNALGLNNQFENRMDILKQSPYFEIYQGFLNGEAEKGPLTLLYRLGFPKSKDKNMLKKFTRENLNLDHMKLLIQYGSLKRDVDIVAVYKDDVALKEGLLYDGLIDINVMKENTFLQKLSLYDIELLEPLLSGHLILGDENALNKIRKTILSGKPSKEAVDYAKKRSLETYNNALFFFHQNRHKRNQVALSSGIDATGIILEQKPVDLAYEELLYSLSNLSYSLSYGFCHKNYEQNKLVGYTDFLKDSIFKELIDYIKNVEHGKTMLSETKTQHFFDNVRNKLLCLYKT